MGMLSRFGDIVSANVNALLDKAEDPAKMIDEYLRKATEDLAEVKKETASVMAEETRTKRLVDDNNAQVLRYTQLAKKALEAGNEDDARVFLGKKQEIETIGASLQTAYAAAHENAVKMREMHDKLVNDINSLNARRQAVKAKMSVARTQEKINKVGASAERMESSLGAFERMEEKADRMLNEATAMSELNQAPTDEVSSLEEKYGAVDTNTAIDDELAELKRQMGL